MVVQRRDVLRIGAATAANTWGRLAATRVQVGQDGAASGAQEVVLVGRKGQPRSEFRELVNAQAYGLAGDNVRDDTAAAQAAINAAGEFGAIYFPKPGISYRVSTLRLLNGQTIIGCGQFGSAATEFQFTGNGTSPVFQLGDGTGAKRQMTLLDLSVRNNGAPCINISSAPNAIVQRVRAGSTGASTLVARAAYRFVVRDCSINASGVGVTAIDLLDNMNGTTIENVTCSGGRGGRAIRVGYAAGLRIISNIIESSLDGIWVGATSDPGDGNCNGVTIENNYIEQSRTPLKLGTRFTLLGLTCRSNFISNNNRNIVAAREAAIQFGRIRGGVISDNSIYVAANEDLFWIFLEVASGGYDNLTVARNAVVGTPGSVYQFKGAFAANASVKSTVGGQCNFDFMGAGDPIGTDHVQEWISPPIDAAVSSPTQTWLEAKRIAMGGKIKSIDIIDANRGVYTNCQLAIGRTAAAGENVHVTNLDSLKFTRGVAPVPLAMDPIFVGSDRTYRVITAAGVTARFRIRIRYRAN
ncbi:glycosyl hydrolase family 28-related protein [Sphingomonas sp.]|uniref:glycosyl hydrolase family 28-related protein n=1 Tax=Sphingomonas sp. TaxID=28214 RepID=UPI00286E5891|nr:glycosyl hydrolase family 28-related protein [Sphingomonas sp.]